MAGIEQTASQVHKPILQPIPVAWQISPSTPFLKLSAVENASTVVEFVAFSGPLFFPNADSEQLDLLPLGSETVRVVTSDAIQNALVSVPTPYELIHITFDTCWCSMTPALSELEVIPESAFDWSRFKVRYHADINSYLSEFEREWLKSKICPDPSFYEVENSMWIEQTQAHEWGLKHYLLAGTDAYVDVLAKNWSWESKGYIDW